MKYALKNLKSFYIHKRAVFFLLISTALLSCIMLEFAYGVFENYRIKQLSQNSSRTKITIDVLKTEKGNAGFRKEMLEQVLSLFSEELDYKLDTILLTANGDGAEQVCTYFTMKNGSIAGCDDIKRNFLQNNLATDYFTEEQEKMGKKVALFSKEKKGNIPLDIFKLDNKECFAFQGEKYQVIGYQTFWEIPMVPFSSLKPETEVDPVRDIEISFREALTKEEYAGLKNSFLSVAEEQIEVPNMDFSEEDNSVYNTMKICAVLIAMMSAVNFAILFQYLLQECRKSFRICRIYGMNRRRMEWNFMADCFMIAFPAFLIGTLVYHWGIYKVLLINVFPYIWNVYSLKKYMVIFGIYFLSISAASAYMVAHFAKNQRLIG